jgi:hypothetical protein
MPEVGQLYAGNYLSASELRGQRLTARIVGTAIEKMPPKNGRVDQRVTVDLDAAKKPLVIGKLNFKKLAATLGTNTDDWLNATITLSPALSTEFGREQEVILITDVIKPSANESATHRRV